MIMTMPLYILGFLLFAFFVARNKVGLSVTLVCLILICVLPARLTSFVYDNAQKAEIQTKQSPMYTYNCSPEELKYSKSDGMYILHVDIKNNTPVKQCFTVTDKETNNIKINNKLSDKEIIVKKYSNYYKVKHGITTKQEEIYDIFHITPLNEKLNEKSITKYIDGDEYEDGPFVTVYMNEKLAKSVLSQAD